MPVTDDRDRRTMRNYLDQSQADWRLPGAIIAIAAVFLVGLIMMEPDRPKTAGEEKAPSVSTATDAAGPPSGPAKQ